MGATCVRLRLGAEFYAIDVEQVLEVAELHELCPVPGSPAAVLGVSNLRGSVIPVLDLGSLLGTALDPPPRRLVVTQRDGERTGLAVTEVSDVISMPDSLEPPATRHLTGAAMVGETLVGLIDLDSVVADVAKASG
jgi:chemotaxis signal transduction protein